ncbi:tyrosine-type recombinase/integrase [Leptolyngbya ohadii]|uniref:tyrosine-type recombinase/integrase n=1 Tax=Leptolyngbya ohadii TaxID=1962290 RepID=UPI000B59CE09|nr:tyrosine-type recombinase/integrase [Leptolyngbya ohadii]
MDASIQAASLRDVFKVQQRDIIAELLADKRSHNTRRAYARDLKDFFGSITEGLEPSPQLVSEFLKLERFTAIAMVLNYKQELIAKGLAEATVNRRLAAIKSLVKYAQKIGKCEWSLEEIEGERVQGYRDTSGVDVESYRKILAAVDRSTFAGKRNYALLLLLWSNVLRRGEVVKLNCCDFEPGEARLRIYGKGRGTQAEWVSLSAAVVMAIEEWLSTRGSCKPEEPLFIALDRVHWGHRLTGDGIYNLVKEAAIAAGIGKHMSPHRIRHSGITEALNLTDGDVRAVQKLSRHKNIQTLLLYDDSRRNMQKDISEKLTDAL